jgi:hypothetical protein
MPKRTSVGGVLVVMLSVAATASAQSPTTSFAELQGRLKVGDTVNVTDDAGKTVKGNVEQVSDTMLVLRSGGYDLALPALSVQRISRPVHNLRNGALIGLAAGFTIGAIGAASSKCDIVCFSSPGGVLLIGGFVGAIGMGTGFGVGSSIHREHVIFEQTTTGHREIAIVPVVSRTGAGLRVEVGF